MDKTSHHRLALLRKATVLVVSCAAIAAVLASGRHVLHVHHFYGVWTWSPPAHTVSIEYHGRKYLNPQPGTEQDLTGCLRVGTAPGHGEIFARPTPPIATAPTVVFVRYPDATIVAYDLSGGP